MNLSDVKKPTLYTSQEVAKQMGISYITLYRMVKDGRINAINIAMSGTKAVWGFRAEDIQAYYDRIPNSPKRPKGKHK